MNYKNLASVSRGRGVSARGSRGGKLAKATAAELVPPAPLGRVVGEFLASDLPRTVSAGKTLGVTDVETIASFNWLNKADAHIISRSKCSSLSRLSARGVSRGNHEDEFRLGQGLILGSD